MKNIQSIKKQIKTIQNIGKLTNAMKVVATSKINSAKNEFINSIEFSKGIYSALADLLFSASSLDLKDILPKTKKSNTL
jgi:F-type H+-transporting ATPase subunit gamma